MALDSYHHGVRVVEVNEGTRTIRTIATAVIGLLGHAEDADATTFPLNTPVIITDVQKAVGKAGTQGTLAKALQAIADTVNTITIVVRVPKGATDEETTSNVIGKALPFGIGAAVGGTGNHLLGRRVIVGSRRAFGAPRAHV